MAAPAGGDGPRPVGDTTSTPEPVVPTGLAELDRVLGGGLTPGSVTLIAGEPGIGKSTLLMQLLAGCRNNGSSLYVSGEESFQQVAARAERVGAVHDDLLIMATTDLDSVVAQVAEVGASLVVIDSIQTITAGEVDGAAGAAGQVRGCAHRLVQLAKSTGVSFVVAGHVTKDGAIAGPRALEHIVDTVVELRGDRHHDLRLLHSPKHRFGATGEVGVMAMHEDGLDAVPDLSALCLAERVVDVAGSAVAVTVEGQRPLCVEVQSLVVEAHGNPRRSAQGLDSSRLQMVLAVIERRLGFVVGANDVWASVVGGVRLAEPGSDLAVALAVVSCINERPVPASLAAFGELGLAGEIRQASRGNDRIREALRLGFERVLVPASLPPGDFESHIVRVATLQEAFRAARLDPDRPLASVPIGD